MYGKHMNDICNRDLSECKGQFDSLEREIRAEFGNLHRFLDEEECKDLERLKREQGRALKRLKERENDIYQQRKDLEKAVAVLNSKLAEEESSKMLKDIQDLIKREVYSLILCYACLTTRPSIINILPHLIWSKQISGQICPAARGGQ
ncbi:E3 ubiquitin-protein ligase TRIM38-like isoform X2 [Phyllopteryx taeniolatus]|uniref:E3 ubiquitin-protein ligase TRIM38-like isoform X2 n=1 Tax=Phyllopteryx taeniolatus TaxID=161469 RepID=UPI002AD31CFB|nr:E3 ubiquitin-protein ligase TRIM38-like isoform X2 [Phyllopteryx taeniolatus]